MTKITVHKVICHICGHEQEIERYDSINDYNKELFPRIVDKSIFNYQCAKCKKEIFSPYPFLFHKMYGRSVQIGYKITPYSIPTSAINPLVAALNTAAGLTDISERYDDIDEFVNRVSDFVMADLFTLQENPSEETKSPQEKMPTLKDLADALGEQGETKLEDMIRSHSEAVTNDDVILGIDKSVKGKPISLDKFEGDSILLRGRKTKIFISRNVDFTEV